MKFEEAIKNKLFKTISNCADEIGLDCYVIGGFVRDYFLKRESKDIDIVVIGSGIEMAELVSKKLKNTSKVKIFKTYGTAMLKYSNYDIEFVGARKESYSPNSRNPQVSKGTLEDDIKRRDFTINSLAIGLNKKNYGKLVDYHNGLEDIKSKLIKTPLDPQITFNDDPLRMLRAIRFASNFDFNINKDLLDVISNLNSRINIITKERIVEEINRVILSPKPSYGFSLLEKTGLLNIILPEISALKGIDEIEGQTHKDNFYHTLEVVDNISKVTDNLWLRWAALLHDVGKIPTKKFNSKIGWTFHGHEFEGSKMVYKIFKRLKMPLNDKMKYVQKIVLMSSRPIVLAQENVTDSAVRRLIFDAGESVDDLMTLCEADITTKNKERFKKYLQNFKIVRNKIIEVEERDNIRNFQPPISGKEIMETFDLNPCKSIGQIKEAIKEAILEGDIKNDYNAAYKLMLEEGKKLGLIANEKR
jgi:tRNA nucleotidyltransferase (CCA-adding enzyme)